jgi:hypothetical protein
MFIALAGKGVHATQEGAAYAAGDTVVIRGGFQRNLDFPWLGHRIAP